MRKKHPPAPGSSYISYRHVLITLFFIVVPFIFLLFFSRVAKIATGALFYDFFISSVRLLIAYVISLVLAWFIAAAFYRGRRSLVALPAFDVLQSFPTFAALPIATIFFGRTNFTVIFFLTITIIWPIFFSIISSFKLIRSDWREAVKISGLRRLDYLRYFLLPASVPAIITGSIIGLGEGWEALVATEIIVNINPGLGSFFNFFTTNPKITGFGIFGLLVLIFSLNKLVWFPLLEWSHHKMEE